MKQGIKNAMKVNYEKMSPKDASGENTKLIMRQYRLGNISLEDVNELNEYNIDLTYEAKVDEEIEAYFVEQNKKLRAVYEDRGLYCHTMTEANRLRAMSFEEWLEAVKEAGVEIDDLIEN